MSIDEQIGRIVLAYQEGREEERQKSEATIAKLQDGIASLKAALAQAVQNSR